METWNAYTADGQLTDHTLTRGEPIPHGLYHLVVECIIRHRDGSTLFMKRDSAKLSYPDYYEATAGGSAMTTSAFSTATGPKPIGTKLLPNSKPTKPAIISGSHRKI